MSAAESSVKPVESTDKPVESTAKPAETSPAAVSISVPAPADGFSEPLFSGCTPVDLLVSCFLPCLPASTLRTSFDERPKTWHDFLCAPWGYAERQNLRKKYNLEVCSDENNFRTPIKVFFRHNLSHHLTNFFVRFLSDSYSIVSHSPG
jgi:hypothetical protein